MFPISAIIEKYFILQNFNYIFNVNVFLLVIKQNWSIKLTSSRLYKYIWICLLVVLYCYSYFQGISHIISKKILYSAFYISSDC